MLSCRSRNLTTTQLFRQPFSFGSLFTIAHTHHHHHRHHHHHSHHSTANMSFLADAIYGDLLLPDDDLAAKGRKLVTVMSLCNVLLAIAALPFLSAYIAETGASGGSILALIASIVLLLMTAIPCYAAVRLTKLASPLLIDYLIGCSNLCILCFTISVVAFPSPAFIIMYGMWVGIAPTFLRPLHLVMLVVHFLLSAYNLAVMNLGWSAVMVPGAVEPPVGALLYVHIVTFILALIIVMTAIFVMTTLSETLTRANNAASLARTVADKLLAYDTDAVREVLKTNDDKDFTEPFHRMAENLDKYRLHIPHWVLKADNGNTEGDEDDEGDIITQESFCSQDITLTSPTADDSTGGVTETRIELKSVDEPALEPKHDGSRRKSVTPKAIEAKAPTKRKEEEGDWIHTPMGLVFVAKKKPEKTEKKHNDKVPMALIFYQLSDAVEVTGQRRAEAVGRFVDRCHELAENTSGALHSFVGGQLLASWNAVHRVNAAEAKATHFLFNLQKEPGDELIQVSGAIVTGKARPYLAGGKKNQVQTITTTWHKALLGCALFASRRRAILIDAATRAACGNEFATRGYDALLCPVRVGHNTTTAGDALDASTMSADAAEHSQNRGQLTQETSGSVRKSSDQLSLNTSSTDLAAPKNLAVSAIENSPRSNANTEAHDPSTGFHETTQTFVLYSVVAEKDGNDDEWMYKLNEANKANGDDAVSNALMMCLDGQYSQAMQTIKRIVDPAVKNDVNVKRLYDRAALFDSEKTELKDRNFALSATL